MSVTLDTIRAHRPEWTPWLNVVAEIERHTADARWDAAVPSANTAGAEAPLLAGAAVVASAEHVQHTLLRLLEVASKAGTTEMATLAQVVVDPPAALGLLAASIVQRRPDVDRVATFTGANADALHAVVALLAIPVLRACHRHWVLMQAHDWTRPYCPICGSWPAFVEVRGIERTRRARCGRCSADWHATLLVCGYCGASDHELLTTLVPEGGAQHGAVEACGRCHGYVKVLTTLQGCPANAVLVHDLANVDLDVAAIAAGYRRPEGAGYDLSVSVSDAGQGSRSSQRPTR